MCPRRARSVTAAIAASVVQPSSLGSCQSPSSERRWSSIHRSSKPAASARSTASRSSGQPVRCTQYAAPNRITPPAAPPKRMRPEDPQLCPGSRHASPGEARLPAARDEHVRGAATDAVRDLGQQQSASPAPAHDDPVDPGPERGRIGEPRHRTQDGHVDLAWRRARRAPRPGTVDRRERPSAPPRPRTPMPGSRRPGCPCSPGAPRPRSASRTRRPGRSGSGSAARASSSAVAGLRAGRDGHGDARQAEEARLLGGWDLDRRRTTAVPGSTSAVEPGVDAMSGRAMTRASDDGRIVRPSRPPGQGGIAPRRIPAALERPGRTARDSGHRHAAARSLPRRRRPDRSWPTPCPTAASAAGSAPTAASSGPGARGSAASARTATGPCGAWPTAPWPRLGLDPIEKKPLFHVDPGSLAYSIATDRLPVPLRLLPELGDRAGAAAGPGHPAAAPVARADRRGRACASGARSIAYTYVEPTVFLEYALDTGRLARRAGLRNLFITDGYATPEAVDLLAEVLDAANVDLKSFDDAFYRRLCGARLAHVLDAIVAYREAGIWLELTTLVIPGQQRRRRRAAGAGRLDRRDPGSRHAVAREPVLPGLPDAGRAAHADRHPAARRGDRARGRAAVRLRRERAGARAGGHAVRGVRPAARGAAPATGPGRCSAATGRARGAGRVIAGRWAPAAAARDGGGAAMTAAGATGPRWRDRSTRGRRASSGGSWARLFAAAARLPGAACRRPAPPTCRWASSCPTPGSSTRACRRRRPGPVSGRSPGRSLVPRPIPRSSCSSGRTTAPPGSTASAPGTPGAWADAARRGGGGRRAGAPRSWPSGRRSSWTAPRTAASTRSRSSCRCSRRVAPGARIVPLAVSAGTGSAAIEAGERARAAARRASRRRRPGRPRDQHGHGALPAGRRLRAGDGGAPAGDPGPRRGGARRARGGHARRRDPRPRLRHVRDRARRAGPRRAAGDGRRCGHGRSPPRRPRTPADRATGRSATWPSVSTPRPS